MVILLDLDAQIGLLVFTESNLQGQSQVILGAMVSSHSLSVLMNKLKKEGALSPLKKEVEQVHCYQMEQSC